MWGEEEQKVFEGGGEGPNSELFSPIRLHMISGRRGGGCRISNHLPFLPSSPLPPTHLEMNIFSSTSEEDEENAFANIARLFLY